MPSTLEYILRFREVMKHVAAIEALIADVPLAVGMIGGDVAHVRELVEKLVQFVETISQSDLHVSANSPTVVTIEDIIAGCRSINSNVLAEMIDPGLSKDQVYMLPAGILTSKTPQELLKPGFAQLSVNRIRESLAERGMHLAGDEVWFQEWKRKQYRTPK